MCTCMYTPTSLGARGGSSQSKSNAPRKSTDPLGTPFAAWLLLLRLGPCCWCIPTILALKALKGTLPVGRSMEYAPFPPSIFSALLQWGWRFSLFSWLLASNTRDKASPKSSKLFVDAHVSLLGLAADGRTGVALHCPRFDDYTHSLEGVGRKKARQGEGQESSNRDRLLLDTRNKHGCHSSTPTHGAPCPTKSLALLWPNDHPRTNRISTCWRGPSHAGRFVACLHAPGALPSAHPPYSHTRALPLPSLWVEQRDQALIFSFGLPLLAPTLKSSNLPHVIIRGHPMSLVTSTCL